MFQLHTQLPRCPCMEEGPSCSPQPGTPSPSQVPSHWSYSLSPAPEGWDVNRRRGWGQSKLKCSKGWYLLRFECFPLITTPHTIASFWLFPRVQKELILTIFFYHCSHCFYREVHLQESLSRSALVSELSFDESVKAIHQVRGSLPTNGLEQLDIHMQLFNQ